MPASATQGGHNKGRLRSLNAGTGPLTKKLQEASKSHATVLGTAGRSAVCVCVFVCVDDNFRTK